MTDLLFLHPSSELLDRYAMNQLSPSQTGYMEEHMLLCHSCCDALSALEREIKMMRVLLAGHVMPSVPVWVRV